MKFALWYFLIYSFVGVFSSFVYIQKIGKERKPLTPIEMSLQIILIALTCISTWILWTSR